MVSYTELVRQAATSGIGHQMQSTFELQSLVQQSILNQLIGNYQSELHTIRAENNEAQQRLDREEIDREEIDREQIEQEEAEENERTYCETMLTLGMVRDPSPIETDEYRQFIEPRSKRLPASEPL